MSQSDSVEFVSSLNGDQRHTTEAVAAAGPDPTFSASTRPILRCRHCDTKGATASYLQAGWLV